jgi:intermediate peptidase
MLKTVTRRPWICPRCIERPIRPQRRLASTAAAILHESRALPVDNAAPGALHDDKTLRKIFDSPNFWHDFSQSARVGLSGKSVGLFQNRYLTDPQGFHEFAVTSLRKAQHIVDKVLNISSDDGYKGIVRDLDRLSDLLCRVIDLSDFVRATHPDGRIQAAATRAYAMMFEYMNVLNTTTGLDKQLNIAMRNPVVTASWSEEEMVVAEILRKDFSKSAIDLPQRERERFVSLSQKISEVGTDFVDYMEPATHEVQFSSSKMKGMDPMIVKRFTRWGSVTIPAIGAPANIALRTVQDGDVRKEIYLANRTASREQIDRLEELLRLRAQLAKLSRYETYGHMALGDKMAKSPESVNKFLQALAKDNCQRVQQELADLIRRKEMDQSASDSTFQAWDKDYYMYQILASARTRSRKADFLSAYFSLGTVMQGLSRLFTRLYGVRFVPHETQPGETWNNDVRRLDVVSETDGHVAVLYCDLFSRPGKSPNPAHFTLRCSREITREELQETSASMTSLFASPEAAASDGMAVSNSNGVLKQLPTIALICDFSTYNGNNKPALLSFNEVTTLFHEMGHAIHSVLGRTSLQNVSGTRCATDFAELPSVLMEHFAADPTVLSLFARHYETDQSLPYELVAEKLALDKRFEGCDNEGQIMMAMLDQSLHSELPIMPGFSSSKVFQDIQRSHGILPPDPSGTSWQGFFGHLYGYGSTYYSYLFDRVLAERIWQVAFQNGKGAGSISRENGERMKESVLKWGGGRDPWKCLAHVLRDDSVENGDEKAMGVVGSWGVKEQDLS